MIILTIRFEKHDQEFDIGPAFPDLSTFYRAAAMAYVQPHTLASQLNRISEERATDLLARCYAEGVLLRCEPELTSERRYQWLREHPEEFAMIRKYAEHRPNFEERPHGSAESREPGTAPGPASHSA